MSAIKDMLKLPPNMITSVITTVYFQNNDTERASKAAAEYAALVARVVELEKAAELALCKLRSTTRNWDESCLFDCNDILAAALDRGK